MLCLQLFVGFIFSRVSLQCNGPSAEDETIQGAIDQLKDEVFDVNNNYAKCNLYTVGGQHIITESSIDFYSSRNLIVIKEDFVLDSSLEYLKIVNSDISIELESSISLYLYRSKDRMDQLIRGNRYYMLGSLLYLYYVAEPITVCLEFDNTYPFDFIFPCTVEETTFIHNYKITGPGQEINTLNMSVFYTEISTGGGNSIYAFCHFTDGYNENDDFAIKEDGNDDAPVYSGSNIEEALFNFKYIVGTDKGIVLYPNKNSDVSIDLSVTLEFLPKYFVFEKDLNGHKITGNLEIMNEGARCVFRTGGLNIIIHSTEAFLDNAPDSLGKSVVPFTFETAEEIGALTIKYDNITTRNRLYVGLYTTNEPSASISVYNNNIQIAEKEIITDSDKKYIVYKILYNVILRSTSPEGSVSRAGSNLQDALSALNSAVDSYEGQTVTVSSDLEYTFEGTASFGSTIPDLVTFDLNNQQTGSIEFTQPGVVVSGSAPGLTIKLSMTKSILASIADPKDAYSAILQSDNAFQLIEVYYDDVYNIDKIYVVKLDGTSNYNVNVYINSVRFPGSIAVEDNLVSFVPPTTKFSISGASCDDIQDCIDELSNNDQIPDHLVIQIMKRTNVNDIIEFSPGKVPETITFDTSKGVLEGDVEIVNSGVIVKGSVPELMVIINIDQSSIANVNDPISSYRIELAAENSFRELKFQITGIEEYEELFLIKSPEAVNSIPFTIISYEGFQRSPATSSRVIDGSRYFSFYVSHFKVEVDSNYAKSETISESITKLKETQVSFANKEVHISMDGATISDVQILTFDEIPSKVVFDANANDEVVTNDVEITDIGVVVSGKLNGKLKLHNTEDNIMSKSNEVDSYVVIFEPNNMMTTVEYNVGPVPNIMKLYLGVLSESGVQVPLCTVASSQGERWQEQEIEIIDGKSYVTISKVEEIITSPPNPDEYKQEGDGKDEGSGGNKEIIIGVVVAVVVVVIIIIIIIVVIRRKKVRESTNDDDFASTNTEHQTASTI